MFAQRPSGYAMEQIIRGKISSIDKTNRTLIHQVSLHRIPGVVTESGNGRIDPFHAPFITQYSSLTRSTSGSSPRFSVNEFFTHSIPLIQGLLNTIHQLRIQQTHQIKAETVHVVLFRPVEHGIENVLRTHTAFRCQFIAASRAVGSSSVLVLTVIVPGYCTPKPGLQRIGVVIYHIHNHPETVLMQRLDGFFQFPDAYLSMVGIGRVASFRNIVVNRIVAPVILLVTAAFVHGTIIVNRHQLDVGHAQPFHIIQTGGVDPVVVPCGSCTA